MSIAEIAQKALDLLPNYRRWMKNGFRSFSGKRICLGNALCKAQTGQDALTATQLTERADKGLLRRTAELIRANYKDRLERGKVSDAAIIIGFNDHPDTKYADVRVILEKLRAE